MRDRRVLSAALLALLAGCNRPHEEEHQPNSPPPGAAAPDFTLKNTDGQFVSLSQFRGKPVLLAYWAVG